MFPVSFFPMLKYGNNSLIEDEIIVTDNNFSIFDFNLVLIPIHKTSTDHWALSVFSSFII